MKAAWSGHVII